MSRQAHSEQFDREMIRLGKSLVVHLFVLLKTAQNYPEGHAALAGPVGNALGVIREVRRHNEEASLRMRSGYLLFGELRLKPDASGVESFFFLLALLKRCGIGGLHFHATVSAPDLMKLAYVLNEAEQSPDREGIFNRVVETLRQRSIASIEVEPEVEATAFESTEEPAVGDDRAVAGRIYRQALAAVSEVVQNARGGQTLRLRKAKRVVQAMIDQILTAPGHLLALTTLRCHEAYSEHHPVNVCILSLTIGARIKLAKATLCELGMAALLHDLGKAEIPEGILNKPGELTADEREIIRRHPVLGVKNLMQLKGLDLLTARLIIGAFEHHMHADSSGYPKLRWPRLSLFGRIIAIADGYDALTSSRVYSRTALPPERALHLMLERAAKVYDPLLLKVFAICLGTYPPGTLLRLSTRELAVVVENGDPARWDRPRVRLIADQAGNEVEGGIVDLATDAHRRIVETLDPYRFGLRVTSW